jgi:hypothetical protein
MFVRGFLSGKMQLAANAGETAGYTCEIVVAVEYVCKFLGLCKILEGSQLLESYDGLGNLEVRV